MGILINMSGGAIQTNHRGRDHLLPPPGGTILLSRADRGRFELSGGTGSWVLIDMPRPSITQAAPNAEDLVGAALSGGGEAVRLVSSYARLVFQDPGFGDGRLDAHVSQTFLDLAALAIGAEKGTAEVARDRGLRAARIEAILQAIADGYADPAFSVTTVAARLNLSERYVQDLLQSTGAGFSERVIELRLQHSASLLARAHLTYRKISEIALSSGFNDLSYFHRCFRRRFGMTPAQARP
jgi:AraC-like DNA-binding protein